MTNLLNKMRGQVALTWAIGTAITLALPIIYGFGSLMSKEAADNTAVVKDVSALQANVSGFDQRLQRIEKNSDEQNKKLDLIIQQLKK